MKSKDELNYRKFIFTDAQVKVLLTTLNTEAERLKDGKTAREKELGRKLAGIATSFRRQAERQDNPINMREFKGYSDPEVYESRASSHAL